MKKKAVKKGPRKVKIAFDRETVSIVYTKYLDGEEAISIEHSSNKLFSLGMIENAKQQLLK